MRFINPVLITLSAILAGCSAMTTITATQPNATVAIVKSAGNAAPRTESFATTSFGNYPFRAEAPGLEPFDGILPLKFNGGYLATDILLFAPAAFFNLREVYAFYEFDVEKKQVKFKKTPEEEWSIYIPLQAETDRAKATFATASMAPATSK